MLTLKPISFSDRRWKQISDLYASAFPKDEQMPFGLTRLATLTRRGVMLCGMDEETFVGFMSLLTNGDAVYLFYFALTEEKRGQGYGTKMLQMLREMYPHHRIFLAREQLDETAANYAQRKRRHEFYLRGGLVDYPLYIREGDVVFDVMGCGGLPTAEEYDAILRGWGTRLAVKHFNMQLYDKAPDQH